MTSGILVLNSPLVFLLFLSSLLHVIPFGRLQSVNVSPTLRSPQIPFSCMTAQIDGVPVHGRELSYPVVALCVREEADETSDA